MTRAALEKLVYPEAKNRYAVQRMTTPDNSDELDRSKLSFSQAEGLAPLPTRLQLGEISQQFRAYLWDTLYQRLTGAKAQHSVQILEPWLGIMRRWHVYFEHRASDEFDNSVYTQIQQTKHIILSSPYARVFDFVQHVMRDPACPSKLDQRIAYLFEECRMAYYVELETHTVMPAATSEEADTLKKAFADLTSAEFGGAKSHLVKAGRALNNGDWAGSVRESIHAVESVANLVAGSDKTTLAKALQAVSKKHPIHPALNEGFKKIYGYTSDENGVRHAELNDPAKVDVSDAQFMLGACAAFVSYLLGKSRG